MVILQYIKTDTPCLSSCEHYYVVPYDLVAVWLVQSLLYLAVKRLQLSHVSFAMDSELWWWWLWWVDCSCQLNLILSSCLEPWRCRCLQGGEGGCAKMWIKVDRVEGECKTTYFTGALYSWLLSQSVASVVFVRVDITSLTAMMDACQCGLESHWVDLVLHH